MWNENPSHIKNINRDNNLRLKSYILAIKKFGINDKPMFQILHSRCFNWLFPIHSQEFYRFLNPKLYKTFVEVPDDVLIQQFMGQNRCLRDKKTNVKPFRNIRDGRQSKRNLDVSIHIAP